MILTAISLVIGFWNITAHIISQNFSEVDCRFFRYGGDEFVIIIVGKNAKESYQLVKKCAANLKRRPFMFKNKLLKITLSCGIASFPENGLFIEPLIQKADKAMYCSKKSGRDAVTLASDIRRWRVFQVFWSLLRITGIIMVPVVLFFILLQFPSLTIKAKQRLGKPTDVITITESGDITTFSLVNDEALIGRVVRKTAQGTVLEITVDNAQIVEK